MISVHLLKNDVISSVRKYYCALGLLSESGSGSGSGSGSRLEIEDFLASAGRFNLLSWYWSPSNENIFWQNYVNWVH